MGEQPRCLIYQVKVGETPSFYDLCIESVARYCKRHNYAHIVQDSPCLRIRPKRSARSENALRLGYLPILEKSNALLHLRDYDRVCVVDADVYVRKMAPSIFDASGEGFSGVIERDLPALPHHVEKVRKYSEGQYRSLTDVDWDWNERGASFYNCGVMVLGEGVLPYLNGETPEEFLRRAEFERFINGEGHWRWSTDQTLLNWWVKKSGMSTTNLDWRWNALYGAVEDVASAHFVHFFLAAKMEKGGAEIPGIIARL